MQDSEKFAAMWSMGFGNMNDELFLREEPARRRRRAIKSDWQTHRMPRTRTHFELGIPLTEDEFEFLAWGHIPEEMEDHWFMYFDGEAFCFHRSWTGFCIYRVYVKRDRDSSGYVLDRVTANRSQKQYLETSDERDAVMVMILVAQALGRNTGQLWERYFELKEISPEG